jgi:hypothetical protein
VRLRNFLCALTITNKLFGVVAGERNWCKDFDNDLDVCKFSVPLALVG